MVNFNDAGQRSMNSGIAMVVLATIAVAVRLATRAQVRASFGLDDVFAVAALALFYAWFGVMMWGLIAGGGGANIVSIAHDYTVYQAFLKSLYILNAIYALAITCVKLSILFLYRRIFTTQQFKRISLGFIALVCIWWLVFTCFGLLPCLPPRKSWHPELDGPCHNFDEFFLGSEIVEIIIDFVILALPIRMISTLQMSVHNKWALYTIFLIGGGVCITGILRLAFTYVPHSNQISFTAAELWGNIHLGVAIICACLPTYRLLFRNVLIQGSAVWSRFNLRFTSRRVSKASHSDHKGTLEMKPYQHRPKEYDQLEDTLLEIGHLGNAATVHPSITSQRSAQEDPVDPNSIVVRSTVDVV